MGYRHREFDHLALDDFEELFADKPRDAHWELIGGRLVCVPANARWEHAQIMRKHRARAGKRPRGVRIGLPDLHGNRSPEEPALDVAMLPDVMVVGGDLEPGATSVDDPLVLFLPGTEARDRVKKWHLYRQFGSLRHYVLVARDRPHLEAFDRIDGVWSRWRPLEGLDAVLALPALGASLSLAEIYRRVIPA